MLPALESNLENHWNGTVISLSGNVRGLLHEMDPIIFRNVLQRLQLAEVNHRLHQI